MPTPSPHPRRYIGYTEFKLDSQHRLPLPRGWRQAEDNERSLFYLVPDYQEHEVLFFGAEEYALHYNFLGRLSLVSPRYKNLISIIQNKTAEVTFDKQYRFSISPELIAWACLKEGETVALVGAPGHGRILSAAQWHQLQENLPQDGDDISQDFADDLRALQQETLFQN